MFPFYNQEGMTFFCSNLLDPFNRCKGYERDLIGKKKKDMTSMFLQANNGYDEKKEKKEAKFIFLFLSTSHTL